MLFGILLRRRAHTVLPKVFTLVMVHDILAQCLLGLKSARRKRTNDDRVCFKFLLQIAESSRLLSLKLAKTRTSARYPADPYSTYIVSDRKSPEQTVLGLPPSQFFKRVGWLAAKDGGLFVRPVRRLRLLTVLAVASYLSLRMLTRLFLSGEDEKSKLS